MRMILIFIMVFMFSCTGNLSDHELIDKKPGINPDYSGITLPPNIAPINFNVEEKADRYQVRIYTGTGKQIQIKSRSGKIRISAGKWRKLLDNSAGSELTIEIFIKKDDQWHKFRDITNHIANESIDNHLVYRLIDPGFEGWNKMGIYQRNLENFDQDPIMINDFSNKNCMNCHSFCQNNSHTMLFHMRGKIAGTVIHRKGETKLVNTKTDQIMSPGVYPAWHPEGRIVAFSVNQIVQAFHSVPHKRIEVMDTLSDIILFDAEKNMVLKFEDIASRERFETFPGWSPDGRFLYFCSAIALPPDKYDQIRYDLLRIAFDPVTNQFGTVDTIVSSARTGLSVSFPRVSPDGKYLMFCMSEYGNFTIWHKESDLYLVNLLSGEIIKPEINSDQTESYHQWSSNGRWIVFSSRRINGLFTRPYFSYFDVNGIAHKPFILPQQDPGFYDGFFKSYNIPEFVTSEVELNPRKLSKIIRQKPLNASAININQ